MSPVDDIAADLVPDTTPTAQHDGLLHPGIQLTAGTHRAAWARARRERPPNAGVRDEPAHALLPAPRRRACRDAGQRPHDRLRLQGRGNLLGVGDSDDIAWSYPSPLPGATQLTDLVAFYDELVDITVDGVPRARPDSIFVETLREEFDL